MKLSVIQSLDKSSSDELSNSIIKKKFQMLWNHTNYESAVNVLIIKDVENLGRAYMDSIVDHNGHRYHLRNNFPRRLQHGHSQRSTKCELFMLHSYYVLEKKRIHMC